MSDDSESPMGQPQFEDWEAAKAKIREKLRWIEILDEAEANLIDGFHF